MRELYREYYHDIHCNASRTLPMGEGGCSCFMYQRVLRAELEMYLACYNKGITEQDARVKLLEELIEWSLNRAAEARHSIKTICDHYTYHDADRLFSLMAQELERFHMGELFYGESIKRTMKIRDKVNKWWAEKENRDGTQP